MRRRLFLSRLLLGLCCLAVLGCLAQPSSADERILEYGSLVTVTADTSLEVTETIRVRAEGQAIRRGIYRDFPTAYKDEGGNTVTVPFEVSAWAWVSPFCRPDNVTVGVESPP